MTTATAATTAPDDAQIHAHADLVFRTCLRLTGNAQDAADVSQEVFIAWMQAQGTINGPVGAWLHGTARLRSLEFLRRNHRRANHERQADAPTSNTQDASWRAHLDDALAELDAPSRALVVEYHLMGAEQADLATRFRCTQATVSRRIAKAMEQLRTLLERRGVSAAPAIMPLWFAQDLAQPRCPTELIAPVLAQAHVTGSASLLGSAITGAAWKLWLGASAAAALLATAMTVTTFQRAESGVLGETVTGDPTKTNDVFVRRTGHYLTLNGKPIHLHGATFYGAPWRGDQFNAYVDTWMKHAQDNGLNSIRICDFIHNSDRNQWRDVRTWENLDYLLSVITKRKMFAILDLSTYRNLIERTYKQDPKAEKDDLSIAAAYDAKNWVDFTAFVSARYKNCPSLAFYSIAGEADAPVSKRISTKGLTEFFDQVSTQLHTGDPNHLISSGGLLFLDWDAGIDWKAIFALPNIQMANVHIYSDGDISVLPKVAEWARQPDVNVPFVIEEFGLQQHSTDAKRAQYVDDAGRSTYFQRIYALGSLYSSVGTLFWNLGPELKRESCDVGPQTPVAWTVVRDSETLLRSSFEPTDAAPTLSAAPGAPAPSECVLRTGTAHTGDKALRFASSGTLRVPAASTIYRVNLMVRANSKLSYWINPEQDNGRHVAVDLHCTDGTWLSESKAVDAQKRSMQAKAGYGGDLPLKQWSEIRCDIGQWLAGKMVDRIVVTYDHASASGPFGCFLDDLVVTNGTP
jgi:RNA polymerase sigma factor (sigma-70 family)